MLRNYFKIAWRNLLRNKTFTLLNLGGLTISLAACLIIFFWVSEELNYDKSANNADRVFRVGLTLQVANQPDKQFAVTSPLLAPVLVKDFPEIEKVVRMAPATILIGYNKEQFFNDKFLYADADFFSVFGYPLLKGDQQTVLKATNSAVISESLAKKLFGSIDNAIGKTITSNDTTLLTVTGVAKDIPANNHFHFDIVAPITLLGANALDGWWNDSYYTYVLVKDPKSYTLLDSKITTIMDEYNGEQNKKIGLRGLHFLQPIRDIHLHSKLRSELRPNGSITSLRIFIGIAIFLLLIACVNYVNLSTATSFKRAKEIGMRKVAGAALSQLVAQFLSESVLIAVIALILAVGLAQLSLPFFNTIAGTEISLIDHLSLPAIALLIGFTILLGIIAGGYPALYLSRVRPVRALKKISGKQSGSLSLRKTLVVFQFSLSIILIIATIIALQQLNYMQSQNLGFSKEQVVAITLRTQEESNAKEIIKKEFEKNSGITLTTASSSTPGRRLSNITVLPEGISPEHIQTMNTLVVDHDFIKAYELKMAAGRGFSKDFNDSSAFVLNETAVKELGWGKAENAIGKGFEWGLGKKGKIIGVVKDFHFNSLQQKVLPVVMHIMPVASGWYGFVSARVNTNDMQKSIESLKTTWAKVFPAHQPEYFFVDEDYKKQYKSEQRLSSLSIIFSILTIFISCLGLLGLVMVAVSQRIKEIGIRKVLGASVSNVVGLLSKDFLKLVLLAGIIAFPIAWFSMNKWLQDFAYRINIGWWVFVLAAILALVIAFITVSFQAVRAANTNPVKNLRTE